MTAENHALVFGASGVSGWALTKECLANKSPAPFARVTALANRPLSLEDSLLPKDSRLQLASGVDLTKDEKTVASLLQSKVPDVKNVTHVFFTAYIEKPDYPSLVAVNTELLNNAIKAIDSLAPGLQSVILQTGGKHYGVEFPDKLTIKAPLLETAPRIPAPYSDNIFYYTQYDALKALSAQRPWTFTEVRPDVIVGFTPGSNFMNIAQGLGLWLTLFKAVHGAGATAPFPGTPSAWTALHTDSFADHLARIELFAALHPQACGAGRAFNGTNGDVVTWSAKWPRLCAHFGLVGAPPDPANAAGQQVAQAFATAHADAWRALEAEHGLRKGLFEGFRWPFIGAVLENFGFDRQYDQGELRRAGFGESVDTVQGFLTTFERMREARIIP